MKKLLKYGIVSLSLATLGIVATATDVPVIGAVLVHAEDGQVVDATVNHSKEGRAEAVEIINEPLKEAVLKAVITDKLEYREVNALLSEAISNGYDQETGEDIGVPNPNYLNYDFSQEELDSITRLRVDASTGGEQHYPKITLPVKELDLAELDKLTNLKALELHGTKEQGVSDFDLSHLDAVTHLSLSSHYDYAGHDQVDAAKLSQATQLEFISGNLTNLSALTNLPNLKHLIITPKITYSETGRTIDTTVSPADLQALIDKGQLETLSFTTDSLADLPSFANLKHLRRLKISVSPIVGKSQDFDVTSIKDNKFLEALSIEHIDPNSALMWTTDGKIVVKEPIFHLTNSHLLPTLSQLSYLNLNNVINLQESVNPISQLSNLTGLQLTFGDVTDVTPLAKLGNLKKLDLTGNKITDVSHLTSLKQLKHLSVRHNEIAELAKIGDFQTLEEHNSPWSEEDLVMLVGANPIVTPEFRGKRGVTDYELITTDGKKIVHLFSRNGDKGGGPYEVSDDELNSYTLFERGFLGELNQPLPIQIDTPPADNNTGGGTGAETTTPPTDSSTGGTGTDAQTPPADNGAPTETPQPAPTSETIITLGNHFKTLHEEYVRLGGDIQPGHYFSPERFGSIVNGLLAGDTLTYGAYEFDVIEKRLVDDINKLKAQQPAIGKGIVTPSAPQADKEKLATTRNQLLAQVDQSRLTDAQKGELAVKIAFAETAEELDKLKAELTSLIAPASQPASDSAAKPVPADQPAATTSAKTLPTTGELSTETLTAMGLSLVLFSLGLAKARKTK